MCIYIHDNIIYSIEYLEGNYDENDDSNFGYSLGYTKIYNMFSFSAVAACVNTDAYSSNKVMGTINFIF